MSCSTLQSITVGCTDNSIGGVKKVYIKDGIGNFAIDSSAITIEFAKDSANFTEDFKPDFATGNNLNTITLNLTIPRRDSSKSTQLMLLTEKQRPLSIVIEDRAGIKWKMGLEGGAFVNSIGDGSGSKAADGSKYTVSFIAEERKLMEVYS
jgi:hypothetical protein